MSVFVVIRVPGDPSGFESYAKANGELMSKVSAEGKAAGAIHHSFAVGDDAIIIMDEWESAEQFQTFFSTQPDVPGIMQAAGATGAPEVTVYARIDTPDAF